MFFFRIVFEQLTKSMEIFIKHKLRFNRKHEIAIVTFEKEALWVCYTVLFYFTTAPIDIYKDYFVL